MPTTRTRSHPAAHPSRDIATTHETALATIQRVWSSDQPAYDEMMQQFAVAKVHAAKEIGMVLRPLLASMLAFIHAEEQALDAVITLLKDVGEPPVTTATAARKL